MSLRARPRSQGATRSSWRSVRFLEQRTARGLRAQHRLWLHGWVIGLVVVLLMWGVARLQLAMGSQSLALRYLVTLGIGYLAYLLVLRIWASMLLRRQSRLDGLDAGVDLPSPVQGSAAQPAHPPVESGAGGDFGGGGASADFSEAIEGGEGLGEAASGMLEAVAGADEGAVVVIPVVAVFLAGLAALFGLGSLLLLYFGWEVLLAVAVEIAFGYAGARTAIRLEREGWLLAAVRLTWKPLLGALACAVALGAAIDFLLPEARSLPHAVSLVRGSAP